MIQINHQLFAIRHVIDILCYLHVTDYLIPIVIEYVDIGIVILCQFFERKFLFD